MTHAHADTSSAIARPAEATLVVCFVMQHLRPSGKSEQVTGWQSPTLRVDISHVEVPCLKLRATVVLTRSKKYCGLQTAITMFHTNVDRDYILFN